MRRTLASLSALALLVLTAGCGDDADSTTGGTDTTSPTASDSPSESATQSSEPTESPAPSETTPSTKPSKPADDKGPDVEVEIEGGKVTPNGQRLQAGVGEPVVMSITSDRAGELHVHSSPEQFVEFEPGTSRHRLVVEVPGLVEVEEHETGVLILLLEVS